MASTTASCSVVEQEINDRFAGENSWYDTHNRGTYALQQTQAGVTVSATRVTGNGKYTDKLNWLLSDSNGGCKIEPCSESQVFSIADSSANYCNLKLPICGSDENCLIANADFSTAGESVTHSGGSGSGPVSACQVAFEGLTV